MAEKGEFDMTRDEILDMQAGREMDITVMNFLFGYKLPADYDTLTSGLSVPHYSTSLDRALYVVSELIEKGYCFELEIHTPACATDSKIKRCYASFKGDDSATGDGESAPLAICRAALLALMVQST